MVIDQVLRQGRQVVQQLTDFALAQQDDASNATVSGMARPDKSASSRAPYESGRLSSPTLYSLGTKGDLPAKAQRLDTVQYFQTHAMRNAVASRFGPAGKLFSHSRLEASAQIQPLFSPVKSVNFNPVFGIARQVLAGNMSFPCGDSIYSGRILLRAKRGGECQQVATGINQQNHLSEQDVSAIEKYILKQGVPQSMIDDNLVCYPSRENCAMVRLFPPKDFSWKASVTAAELLGMTMGLRVKASAARDYIVLAKAHKGDALADFAKRENLALGEIHKFGDAIEGCDRELLVSPFAYDVSTQAGNDLSGFARVSQIINTATGLKAIATDYDGTLADGYLSPEAANQLTGLLARGVKVAIITANEPENILSSLSANLDAKQLTCEQCKNLSIYFYNGNERWSGEAVKQALLQRDEER